MKKAAVQGGLAALEKAAGHEGEKSRQQQENDDEHIGDRRGKIAAQLPFGDGLDVGQGIHFAASFPVSGSVMLRKTSSRRPSSVCNSSTCQALAPRQDIAGQFAVLPLGLGINPRPHPAVFLLDDRGAARVGHAGKLLHQLRALRPADNQQDRSRQIGFLLQLLAACRWPRSCRGQ